MTMNSKQRKTLKALFENPVRSNIAWNDIERLFVGLEATILEGEGPRVCVLLNDIRAVFHRPHPQKEASRGMVRSVRQFLTSAGIHQ
ncbi:MAG: type II toxin-antitoxin system HicA family toxin [SAR324 cluster bacterium]|nr:type II toxin-antitoxin system HicA family toxin [SAR324 cluster bacterium]